MGRGRRKMNPRRHREIAMVVGRPHKSDETKINMPEGTLEFMKNMNQQELVDWHVKTSGTNASGC